MIYYRDTTFCASEVTEHTCGRGFTEQDAKDAEKWWGGKDYPVAYGKFCKEAELENLIRNNIHTFADEYLELDECVAALTAYTNKQIEEVLDRLLEHGEDFTTFGDAGRSVAVEYIEAERKRLKGGK